MITLDDMKAKSENLKNDKKELETKISGANHVAPDIIMQKIQNYIGKKPINTLSYEEQKKIVNQLVDTVSVTDESIKIIWNI
jgi:hypothetical protein